MRPSAAERARTAVAAATVGGLTAYPRQGPPLTSSVRVHEEVGRIVLTLPSDSPLAQLLRVRPRASVRVAPSGCDLTTVSGAVRRVPERAAHPVTRFVLDPVSVRLGAGGLEVVAAEAYRTAEPDPLRHDAREVLAHLRAEHGEALAHCLRAQGHEGLSFAEAVGLDRYGLDLAAVDDDGVSTVRLAFPAPVRSLAELAPHLLLPLRGACPECAAAR